MDFNLIKTRIQQYKLSSLVHNTLETLNIIQKKQNARAPFWQLLVLLKWSYLHTKDSNFRKNVTNNDLRHLLSLIEKFEGDYLGLTFKNSKSITQSFRIVAYQQFDFQDTFYNSILDRQIVLFIKIKTGFDVELEFERVTGITILGFLNYCYLTYIAIEFSFKSGHYNGVLHKDYFDLFSKAFSKKELDDFLKLLTIVEPSDFKNLQKLGDEQLQLYETNFFITKPFLFFRKQYRLPHRSLLTQTIKHFIYTYLKASSASFPDDFGKRLERYVEFGLRENKIVYLTEGGLRRQFQLTKVADYKIDDDILIECKATELHPRSGVLRLPNILTRELNSSITKAYSQLLSTAHAIDPNKEWYGIIVTYREMYLGFGSDAWDEFLQIPTEEFINEAGLNISILPPTNLFFIPLEYWDYIMQVVKEGKATIKQILQKAKELNESPNPAERVFLIEQVLFKHFKIERLTLSYLDDAHTLIDIVPK